MDQKQRECAVTQAQEMYNSGLIGVDADPDISHQFDEVEPGVWVRAWVFVPKEQIPGYTMQPPAAASTVSVEPMDYIQFRTMYIGKKYRAHEQVFEEDIDKSWREYFRNPATFTL